MSNLVLDYSPREAFVPYHERDKRWAVIVAHRRCGKTVACINDLIRAAATIERPNGRFGYIAPQLNQAKDIAWTYLKHFAAPIMRPGGKNESDLWVELVNGARIRLYGGDNADRMRGGYFDGAVVDEYADMRPSVWSQVVRPMLSDRGGWATFIGTPKGRNQFYEKWAEAGRERDRWFRLMLKSSETGVLSLEELLDARRDMTPEEFAQEYECSFEAAIVGSYYGRAMAAADREGRIWKNLDLVEGVPVHTAWDLGKSDSTSIWLWQIAGGVVRVVGFYENHGHELDHYVATLNAMAERRGFKFGTDYLPHDAEAEILGMKKTRVETLTALGRVCHVVPLHTLHDGINAARLLIKRAHFDETECEDGLEALRQYRREWNDELRAFRDAPRHDWTSHPADAFRYMAMALRDPVPPREEKKPPPDSELRFESRNGRLVANMDVRTWAETKARKRRNEE